MSLMVEQSRRAREMHGMIPLAPSCRVHVTPTTPALPPQHAEHLRSRVRNNIAHESLTAMANTLTKGCGPDKTFRAACGPRTRVVDMQVRLSSNRDGFPKQFRNAAVNAFCTPASSRTPASNRRPSVLATTSPLPSTRCLTGPGSKNVQRAMC